MSRSSRSPPAWRAHDAEQQEELVHRFTVALRLLHHLEPVGVGARSLGECLSLQLKAMQADGDAHAACATALRICAQPMELLARRDVKRLSQLCGDSDAQVRAAIGLITRLEPKPGRRFVDVERNIVIPDVLVTKVGRGAQARFRVQLNPDVMPQAARSRYLCGRAQVAQGRGPSGAAAAAAGGALVHQEHPAALRHHPARVQRHRRAPEEFLRARRTGNAAAGAARNRRRTGAARIHHQPGDHGQVHVNALWHLRAQVFLRLRPGYRNRRQRFEHRRSRADQAVRRFART